MARKQRLIAEFMTKNPHSIGVEQSIATAQTLMRQRRIRHLPVLHGGRLVGLLSLRDIHLVETFSDIDPDEVTVEEAMSADVYQVPPSAPITKVAGEMAKRKLGSAVVVDSGKVVGVFTTIDALKLLSSRLSA
jgi:acetoin utilization protein AcuB